MIILFICSDHVTRTPTNGSAVVMSHVSVCITWAVCCTVTFWSRDSDVYLTYILFGIIWHNFMSISRETGTSKRCLTYVYRSTPEIFRFQPIFHFILTVPLIIKCLIWTHFSFVSVASPWVTFAEKQFLKTLIFHVFLTVKSYKGTVVNRSGGSLLNSKKITNILWLSIANIKCAIQKQYVL